MCGRFALTAKTGEIENLKPGLKVPEDYKPRYNIAPSQSVPSILNIQPDLFTYTRWGLVPSWSKEQSQTAKMINARCETLTEKPTFSNLIKKRRCVIISDGFFEWKTIKGDKRKQPYFIRLKSGKPFAFAGLWDEWRSSPDNILRTCSIITTEPNDMMAEIHNRMPAILEPSLIDEWLSVRTKTEEAIKMLKPYFSNDMIAYPVSHLVNSPALDIPECVASLS